MMKNILIKLLYVIAFILTFAVNVFAAQDLGITSVIYDNSSSFLTINTFDNDEYSFSAQPKLFVVPEENKAYFDINSAVLKSPVQDIVVNSQDIKEIVVSQFSTNPNIVRVVINYNNGFNPANIQLRKLNNTLFIRFKNPVINNYYFQHIYSESAVPEVYEGIVIQTPVTPAQNGLLEQINSAFKLGETTADKNFILAKKDIILQSKYYIDNLDLKNNNIVFTGVGSLTLSKPIYLSSPSRVAFDVQNAVVNPAIRNRELKINQVDTVKVGQFNKNTARIVITCNTPERFIPVIYGDSQRLLFIDKNNFDSQTLFSSKVDLNNIAYEKNDENTHSIKLVFSKPAVFSISRVSSSLEVIALNVDKYTEGNIKSTLKNTPFSGVKTTALKGGGVKFIFPIEAGDSIDIHAGMDGKTLRIKEKFAKIELPKPKIEQPVVVEPVILPHKYQDKKYIVIDPGHGGSDCGATRNGIYEKDITLDISKRVADLLQKKGYIVEMTRTKDETVSLQERVEFSENINPDVFVSIHVNSSNIESPNGLETHYYKDNSLVLAKNVHASMLNNITAKDRGLFKSKFYVINHTTAPAILVEIGFISNPSERAQLVSESRKQATARAIAEGINDYFK